jgi:flagellar basal-body rod protein FlgC
MGLFDALNISASGLTAQRLRMDVTSANLANAETTRTPEGGAYKRQDVILQKSSGSDTFAGSLAGAKANVTAMQTTKQVFSKTIELL